MDIYPVYFIFVDLSDIKAFESTEITDEFPEDFISTLKRE